MQGERPDSAQDVHVVGRGQKGIIVYLYNEVLMCQVARGIESGNNHGDGDVRHAVFRRIADPHV